MKSTRRGAALVVTIALGGCASPTAVQPVVHPHMATSQAFPRKILGISNFCKRMLKDNEQATAVVLNLVDRPDGNGLVKADFSTPRDYLAADAQHAPYQLRPYLNTEVDVLGEIITALPSGNDLTPYVSRFRDAATATGQLCPPSA
jgi:hypothetical protein